MSDQRESAPWWRWLLLPCVVVVSWALAVALGTGTYLLLFDLLCPSEARFDSSCYTDAMLLTEKLMILAIAGLSGVAVIWSGYLATPKAPFLTGQWLALIGAVVATLALLALDWGMWPLYGAFLTGMALALLGVKYRLGQG
tara:strand:- start:104 stop:526 length:423 start_codon:yes stop_codon:yes gene_type:complete